MRNVLHEQSIRSVSQTAPELHFRTFPSVCRTGNSQVQPAVGVWPHVLRTIDVCGSTAIARYLPDFPVVAAETNCVWNDRAGSLTFDARNGNHAVARLRQSRRGSRR